MFGYESHSAWETSFFSYIFRQKVLLISGRNYSPKSDLMCVCLGFLILQKGSIATVIRIGTMETFQKSWSTSLPKLFLPSKNRSFVSRHLSLSIFGVSQNNPGKIKTCFSTWRYVNNTAQTTTIPTETCIPIHRIAEVLSITPGLLLGNRGWRFRGVFSTPWNDTISAHPFFWWETDPQDRWKVFSGGSESGGWDVFDP